MKIKSLPVWSLLIIYHLYQNNFQQALKEWEKLEISTLSPEELSTVALFLQENNQFADEVFNVFENILTAPTDFVSLEVLAKESNKLKFLNPIVEKILPFISSNKELSFADRDKIDIEVYLNFFAVQNNTLAQYYVINKVLVEQNSFLKTEINFLNGCNPYLTYKGKQGLNSLSLGVFHLINLINRKQRSTDKDKDFLLNLANFFLFSYQKITDKHVLWLEMLNQQNVVNSSSSTSSNTATTRIQKKQKFNTNLFKTKSHSTSASKELVSSNTNQHIY